MNKDSLNPFSISKEKMYNLIGENLSEIKNDTYPKFEKIIMSNDTTTFGSLTPLSNNKFIKITENIYSNLYDNELLALIYFYISVNCGENGIVKFTMFELCNELGLQTNSGNNKNWQAIKNCITFLIKNGFLFVYTMPNQYEFYRQLKKDFNFFSTGKISNKNFYEFNRKIIDDKNYYTQGITCINESKINDWIKNFNENIKPDERLSFYFKFKNAPTYKENTKKFVPLYYSDVDTILNYCFQKNIEIIFKNKSEKNIRMINPINYLNVFIIICSFMKLTKQKNNLNDVSPYDYSASVAINVIANELNINVKTIMNVIKDLEEMGLLQVDRNIEIKTSMDKAFDDFTLNKENKNKENKEDKENKENKTTFKKKNTYYRPFNPIVDKINK